MDFKIKNRQKYLFTTSAVLLILCTIVQGLPQSVKDNINFNWTPLKNLLFAASYSYVLYIFITYFKFYSLRTLSVLTTILLICELISTFILILNSHTTIDLESLRTVINILTIIVEIIWLFYLFPLKTKEYTAILSLYKYGIAIIVTFFFAIVVTFNLVYSEDLTFFGIQDIILAIPYIFLIDFGIKLKHDQDIMEDT